MRPAGEDPLLLSARREALTVLALWIVTTAYCVSYCYWHGYAASRDDLARMASELTFVLGFPSWVFWGLIVPWFVCVAISAWFAFHFMEDVPLGDDSNDAELNDAG